MAQMSMLNILKKGSEMPFDHEPEFRWQEDAACRFQPYTLFEIASLDSAISEGLNVNEIKDLNNTNLSRAQEICNTCPVWDMCYTTARSEDFEFTMRAGIFPTRLNATKQGRPSGAALRSSGKPVIARGKVCNKCQHDDWITDGKVKGTDADKYRCRICRNARRSGGTPPRKFNDPSQVCDGGHDLSNWHRRSDQDGWRCLECDRNKSRARREARAKMDS